MQFAGLTPGTVLWQYDPNDTVAQQFSFEDAGGGFVWQVTSPLVSTGQVVHVREDLRIRSAVGSKKAQIIGSSIVSSGVVIAMAARSSPNASALSKDIAPLWWEKITILLQARRIEQKSEGFKERMHQRNGIEGTISELTRAHGMRRNRLSRIGQSAIPKPLHRDSVQHQAMAEARRGQNG